MLDKFNDKGGNGGASSELDCGAGYKIAGYTTLISLQVLPDRHSPPKRCVTKG
jgi:hypothetical protein